MHARSGVAVLGYLRLFFPSRVISNVRDNRSAPDNDYEIEGSPAT